MRNRILHLADLHLGDSHDYLGAGAAMRRDEANSLLRRIVERVLAPESQIGGVLVAGDLFDSYDPPESLVESVLSDLGRLVAAGIEVLTIPGNHDEYSYPTGVYRRSGARWPGVLVTQPTVGRVATWKVGGVEIDLYAMAFVAGRSAPPYDRFEIQPGPAKKIAVLHASLDADWSDRSLPLRSNNLAGLDLDYLALGHIHRPTDRRVGRAWACYPGRIEGGSFEDPGGAGLVEIDPGAAVIAPMRREFPSRSIEELRVNLSGFDSEDALEMRLEQAADREKIVRVRLEGIPGFRLEPDRLLRRWAARFCHLDLKTAEGGMELPVLDDLVEERTIRGAFARIAARELAGAAEDAERLRLLNAALRYGLDAFSSSNRGTSGALSPGESMTRRGGSE